ncbi:hypothetical protein CC85DRAFT_288134 [Cutaneotrichosporon oleaginosum]|uniref:CENP-V/GFA domain-containing protein n=1 Tax=Cutaneotrichosporon oleaginosum TaxID=879819 RepID=A0A0J1AWW7_9TREE|nr:uncharacterized protein CC85DRAFT_288134 [Cutaneotrichosporon oleaginosum]KLT39794.1 hypothetical protein CC85DRAFT_288134 [Cutaneotrichosporon oleaginosum]TXT10319.1 hypothetical protein COLE_04253 [Cutaneotrichosporon oleaginosum]
MVRLDGKCNCGALSIAVEGHPSIVGICHCTHCRRFTGNVSTYIIAFPINAAQITGHPAQWTTRADSGYYATRFFCAKCGSSMYAHHDVRDARVFINGGHCTPGTLPPPMQEFWLRSSETWDTAHPNTLVLERQITPTLAAPSLPRRISPPVGLVCGPTAGGCNCGRIQVRLKEIKKTIICHCSTCRRFTGSVSAYLITAARDELEIVGCPKLHGSVADSGNAVTRMFCPVCGSSICIMQDHNPTVEVYGGILPPGSLPPPSSERFRHNAEPWAKVYNSVMTSARRSIEGLLNTP